MPQRGILNIEKSFAKEQIVRQIFELTSISLDANCIWLYNCKKKKRAYISGITDQELQETESEVCKKLKIRCSEINDPAYFILNDEGVKTLKEEPYLIRVAFLFPLHFSHEEYILVMLRNVELFNDKEFERETERVSKLIKLITSPLFEVRNEIKTNTKDSVINSIMIQDRNNGKLYPLSDVLYLEAHGNYTYVHLSKMEKPVLKTMGLKNLESRLPKNIFVRIHKSILVNKHHVASYSFGEDGNNITLSSGKILSVAVRRKNDLIIALKNNNLIV